MSECLVPEPIAGLELERTKYFSNSSVWEIFDLVPLPRPCAAAENPLATVPGPNDPGHDPQFRLSRKVNGKTVNESFATPAALRKPNGRWRNFSVGNS